MLHPWWLPYHQETRLQSLLCAEKISPAHVCICMRKIHNIRAIFCKKLYCRIEKHSKCKMAMFFGCQLQNVQPNQHALDIFVSRTRTHKFCHEKTSFWLPYLFGYAVHKFFSCGHGSPFHSRISGRLIRPPRAFCKLCKLARRSSYLPYNMLASVSTVLK